MSLFDLNGIWQKLIWPWRPESNREAGSGIVANFLLHWFPNRISLRSLAFSASLVLFFGPASARVLLRIMDPALPLPRLCLVCALLVPCLCRCSILLLLLLLLLLPLPSPLRLCQLCTSG